MRFRKVVRAVAATALVIAPQAALAESNKYWCEHHGGTWSGNDDMHGVCAVVFNAAAIGEDSGIKTGAAQSKWSEIGKWVKSQRTDQIDRPAITAPAKPRSD